MTDILDLPGWEVIASGTLCGRLTLTSNEFMIDRQQ
jgi:hypothetical protein